MDVSGEQQINLEHNIYKRRLDENGKPLEKPEKEKVGSSEVMNITIPPTLDPNRCESCYGAEVPPKNCCNTCEDVQNAYRMRGWAVPDSNNFVQCVREGWSKKLESVDKEGCQIFGYLDVNRVAGNFHIAPGKTFTQHHVHVHDLQPFAASQFNLTHKIRHLSFGHSIPGKTNPLDGTVQAAHVVFAFLRAGLPLKPTVLTVPLSLECSSVSVLCPQLCIDAETHQDCDGKVLTQPPNLSHDCVCFPLRANAAPILLRFFHT
ncbi:Endoplasmic reticulum-Golgi intermediate compartment protein 3 [Araneus ventricosus]|nr:Endoplasmic reticulum-Golgi intermediate compartment protein 3 [Araneus ventricosus]GBN78025.1 Endoplasmic reticulum-Golgi intermediate compartment protein 3 [Araneus ventricosus]GBN78043.1 Endoplasmic reticulum-Golgi intermediate compartment protein 3 [Araneus ventricosus]